MKIYNIQIIMVVNVVKSTSHRESIFTYDKNSKVADSYILFAKEVMLMVKKEIKMLLNKILLADDIISTQEQKDDKLKEKVVNISLDDIDF